MSRINPSIVIVPGAWQKVPGYKAFSHKLVDLGYPTEIVPLPSVGGTSEPLPGLEEDIKAAKKVLERRADDGEDIILLCHSYGGLVGSNAIKALDLTTRKAQHKSGGVIMVLYMSAFIVPKGQALLGLLGGQPLPWMNIEGEKTRPVEESIHDVAFHDVPKDVEDFCRAHLTYSSTSVFASPSVYEPWNEGMLCAYIFCTEDNALPHPVQQSMAAQLGDGALTWSLKSGHCPFLSVPEQLAEVIEMAAEIGLKRNGV